MKVLNLQCSRQHSFEGWFGSEDDFQSQLTRGLIECPLCADKGIQKLPSAPRLNFGGHQAPDGSSASPGHTTASAPAAMSPQENSDGVHQNGVMGLQGGMHPSPQEAFLKALRHVLAHTEDVGQQFADEARRMHYGEAEARSIRGQASARETVELMEEGIEVMPLPLPAALKETLQ